MNSRIILTACCSMLLFAGNSWCKTPAKAKGADVAQRSAQPKELMFIENKGQITDPAHHQRSDIQYRLAGAGNVSVFIGSGALHYQFTTCENESRERESSQNALPKDLLKDKEPVKTTFRTYRMDVTLLGANKDAVVVAEQPQEYHERYYTEVTGVDGITAQSYRKITYKNIYPKIDWVLYSTGNKLKHEFVVHEGGNVSDIRFKYGGTSSLQADDKGNLIATAEQGKITEDAPYCFQKDGKAVEGRFIVNGEVVSYNVAQYKGELVIDPSLSWVRYMGPTATDASSQDAFNGVVTDAAGNVFVSGRTTSSTGIATSGSYSSTYGGSSDAILAKYNSAGTLLWSTYFGGSGFDYGMGIAIDGAGDIYMTGATRSLSGISTPGAHQAVCTDPANGDAFLVKFTNAGARVWGTYYGGEKPDYGYSVAVDASGNVYFGGNTASTTAIASAGAHQTTVGGTTNYDGFLAKFSSTGTFAWGTYYGSTGDDQGSSVMVDNAGNPYLAGFSNSTTAIATSGAHQSTNAGNYDAFLVKFDPSGVRQWGTYYGGTGADNGYAATSDASGNIYLTGYSNSTTGIATAGAYQASPAVGVDIFLVKFNSLGVRQWGTYYGGNGMDIPNAIVLDPSNNIFITGRTTSTSGIATADAYQGYYADGLVYYDAVIAKFSNAGMRLWATYYGFYNYYEYGNGIAADALGNIYVAGTKGNCGFPYEGPAYGDDNAFLIKINQVPSFVGPAAVCVGTTTTYTHDSTGGTWSSSNTSIASIGSSSGVMTAVAPGTVTISYALTSGVVTRIITIDSVIATNPITGPSTVCTGATQWLGCATPGGTWSGSDPSIALVGATNGSVGGVAIGTVTISYTASNSCGTMTATKVMTVLASPVAGTISGSSTVCVGGTITLTSSAPGGSWSNYNTWVAAVDSTTGVITGVSTGPSNITYSMTNSCGTALATKMVTVNAAGTPATISGSLSVCTAATTTLSASISSGTWSSGAPGTATVSSGGVVGGVIAGTATISYAVASGCGVATSTAVVTVNAAPSPTITGSSVMCITTPMTLSSSAPGGTWSSSATGIATVGSSGIVSGMAEGAVTISYALSNSCGAGVATHAVTVEPVPVASITGTSVICSGSATTLSSPMGGSWSSSASGVAIVAATGVVTGASPGTAIITVSLSNSCGSATDTQLVTVDSVLSAGLISGPSEICAGTTATFSATGAAGGTWTTTPTTIASVSSAGIVSALTPGTASVSYSLANSCGAATANTTVNVVTMPTAGTLSGASTVCVGSVVTLSSTVTGGTWSAGSGAASVGSAGEVSGVATSTADISYTVTNACGSTTATETITVNTLPIAATVTGTPAVCEGGTTTLTASTSGGTWTGSGGATVSSSGEVTGVTAGTALITYTLTNSCGNATTITTVVVVPASICSAGITSTHVVPGVSIFPNPSNGTFNITWPAVNELVHVTVTNVLGQVVATAETVGKESQLSLNLSSSPAGNYVVAIQIGTEVHHQKITVVR